ncbi:MAG: histidine phosphatase family protein [Fuerstiella sp.]
MSKIVLIHPGRTDYDDQSRLLGALEIPMNSAGQNEVADIVRQLKDAEIQPSMIYTSTTNPASMTAQEIGSQLGAVKVKQLEELENVHQGLWQGLPEEEVRKRYPQFFKAGREKPQTICPPQGETLCDAAGRMQKVLSKAIRKYEVLAIVVSDPIASVIRCILQERGMTVSSCLSGEDKSKSIECFDADRFDLENFVNWESCQDSAKTVASGAAEAASS